jgi:hypothetical protein
MNCSRPVLVAGAVGLLLLVFAAARAADRPHGLADIAPGASYVKLAAELDFRDIHAAIAQQERSKADKPDLGRRGYGCARRDDAFADIACVSHDERFGGVETREIRLHFLGGVLQQFSLTAEIRHYDAVMRALRGQNGPPQTTDPAPPGGYPSSTWRNADSSITAYGGTDLVFVSFELASYGEAVKRKQARARQQECR